jgi:hypothetical protein
MPEIEAGLTDVDRSIMTQTIEPYSFQVHQGSGIKRDHATRCDVFQNFSPSSFLADQLSGIGDQCGDT